MSNLITVLPVTLEQQLEALKGSIAKWQGIVDGTVEDKGADNCPCCQAFYRPSDYNPQEGCYASRCCRYCPVAVRSQNPQCYGTPYILFAKWYNLAKFGSPCSLESVKEKAQAELDFLQETYDWLVTQTEPVYAVYPKYDTVEQSESVVS